MLDLPKEITACLFDLDGVLTQTAKVHAEAWKQSFDSYLRERSERTGAPFVEFDRHSDYDNYVDGKPRLDGVRSFLASRGIQVPEGDPSDPPTAETINGLGTRKNDLVLRLIHEHGVEAYDGSVRFVKQAREQGLKTAVVSSSNNCQEVLQAAGIEDLFGARIDGRVAEREHLKGKPAPDTFLAGARALSVEPSHAAVFEDAQAGVQAGRAGNFGWVVGVNRTGQAQALRDHGANIVVDDLADLLERPVIGPEHFGVHPWTIPEQQLDLDVLAQTEAIFALSNGHIGMRGNLEEGEPAGIPGTYLNAFFETRPLPYAESGYGYPEAGQTMINVTNGKVIRLLVDDEPFDVRYGRLLDHERVLDMREGVLRRTVDWCSPAGRNIRIRTTRLVSFMHRAIAAICYEVETCDEDARIVVQSELVTNEPIPATTGDPRAAAALRAPLEAEWNSHHDLRALLVHRTRSSGLRMAASMDHIVDGPEGTEVLGESDPDLARVTISTELQPGQTLRVIKFLAYGWSSRRTLPSLRDQVDAALASARRTGWDGLLKGQVEYLDDMWANGDVEIDGDAALQQAIRFALFHVVQAAARSERRAIPAKGLTGNGYDGHTFWDTEAYTVPVLSYVAPPAARDVLTWRHTTMGQAAERARVLGLAGVTFPWRTIRGHECSGYWPAGTAAFHINADIADAVRRYLAATGDEEFEKGDGLELVVATARLWRSLGHHDVKGGFHIDGVTGPDEYSALADNNVYTNLMAARNLTFAAELATRHPQHAIELGVRVEEIAGWRDAASAIVIPRDPDLGVTQQNEGFTRLRRWDFEHTTLDQYPLLLHFHNYLLYSSQVIKQADLVFALYSCGEYFSAEQKARDFDYYERMTVRDSSLSAAIQAIVAAEVGYLELAYDYLAETAFLDLRDLNSNTRDGVHMAALAGSWLVAVAGFGGMRDYDHTLSFAPRLPSRLMRLRFGLCYRGRRLKVEVTHDEARYELAEGEPVELTHHGRTFKLRKGSPKKRPISAISPGDPPPQPPGRAPRQRHSEM